MRSNQDRRPPSRLTRWARSGVPGAAVVAVVVVVMLLAGPLAGEARADRPTALVEDASASVPGVQVMDYLTRGTTVKLGAGQTLTLSYLHSCVNETIRGGTVTVGLRESEVAGGKVERTTLPCDGGHLLLTASEAGKAGVTVMRDGPIAIKGAKPRPQITLYRTQPVIVTPKPGLVKFEPIEGGKPLDVFVPGPSIDLAGTANRLTPGALYRVTGFEKSYVVKVDPAARSEGGPALGRLIRF